MYKAGNVAAQQEYVICLYIRLSIEDDDVFTNSYKTESGSITTQRALLRDYIKNHKEFEGCTVIEKCEMKIANLIQFESLNTQEMGRNKGLLAYSTMPEAFIFCNQA